MKPTRTEIEPIHVLPEFVCEAIPAPAFAAMADKLKAKFKDKNGKTTKSSKPIRKRSSDKSTPKKNGPAKSKPPRKKRPSE